MLLAVLGGVILAAAGVGPRPRLILLVCLIAAYVPIAGAGPSIQRAGVMGVAGLLAALAGRPADRAYLPMLAAVVTLLLNPYSAGEVGWQLSFAAVLGIALWAAPIRDLLRPQFERRIGRRLARPLAEGAGLTLAATLVTAPLMAHYFESVSLASLPANLLVLPLVPPVMWLGMIAGLLGQLPIIPVGWIGALEGPLLDLIGLIANGLGGFDWALAGVRLSTPGVIVAYIALAAGISLALRSAGRRQGLGPPRSLRAPLQALVAATGALLLLHIAGPGGRGAEPGPPTRTLQITALDIGQGDSILLRAPETEPVLIDTGPPGGGVGEALRERGIGRLGSLFLTHEQLDHSGALGDVLAASEVERAFLSAPAPESEPALAAADVPVRHLAAGDAVRLGPLRIDVLWPPPGAAPTPGGDLNLTSFVLAARYRGWSVLLAGDAEQEITGLDPGPLDVLKLAHHGSLDAGLPALLARSAPRLALIGVGAENTYGHPTPETLTELTTAGVCVLRTDLGGDSWAELGPDGIRAGDERGVAACAAPR